MKRTLTGVILVPASLAIAAAASPAVTEYATREAIAGEPSEIGHHARWDTACEALDAPRLTVERAPSHGSVCVSTGEVQLVVSRSNVGLSCICKSVNGVHVVYHPQSGFTGSDTIRYGLDVPEGHVSFEVSIVIKLGRMKSSPVSTSTIDAAQPSGPMLECPPLAS